MVWPINMASAFSDHSASVESITIRRTNGALDEADKKESMADPPYSLDRSEEDFSVLILLVAIEPSEAGLWPDAPERGHRLCKDLVSVRDEQDARERETVERCEPSLA